MFDSSIASIAAYILSWFLFVFVILKQCLCKRYGVYWRIGSELVLYSMVFTGNFRNYSYVNVLKFVLSFVFFTQSCCWGDWVIYWTLTRLSIPEFFILLLNFYHHTIMLESSENYRCQYFIHNPLQIHHIEVLQPHNIVAQNGIDHLEIY